MQQPERAWPSSSVAQGKGRVDLYLAFVKDAVDRLPPGWGSDSSSCPTVFLLSKSAQGVREVGFLAVLGSLFGRPLRNSCLRGHQYLCHSLDRSGGRVSCPARSSGDSSSNARTSLARRFRMPLRARGLKESSTASKRSSNPPSNHREWIVPRTR